MKKVLLTLVGLGLFASQLLAYASTEATFTASDDQLIRVIVNGRVMNKVPRSYVKIDNLRPGDHRVQLQVFGRKGRRALVNERINLRSGYLSKFRLQRHRQNRLRLLKVGEQPTYQRERYLPRRGSSTYKQQRGNSHKGQHRNDRAYEDQNCNVDHSDRDYGHDSNQGKKDRKYRERRRRADY